MVDMYTYIYVYVYAFGHCTLAFNRLLAFPSKFPKIASLYIGASNSFTIGNMFTVHVVINSKNKCNMYM